MKLDEILKLIFDNITLIGIFLLIGSFIKLFIYYKLFGIYIYEFLDIQEALTLFINNCIAFLAFFLSLLILVYISTFLTSNFIYIVPLIFTIFSILFFLLNKRIFLYEIFFQNLFIWGLFICFKRFEERLSILFDNSQTSNNFLLLNLLVMFIITSVLNAWNEYYKVKYKFHYNLTTIEFEDETFISSTDCFYIGKTKDFVFIYDKISNSSIIKPASKIKRIVFKR